MLVGGFCSGVAGFLTSAAVVLISAGLGCSTGFGAAGAEVSLAGFCSTFFGWAGFSSLGFSAGFAVLSSFSVYLTDGSGFWVASTFG